MSSEFPMLNTLQKLVRENLNEGCEDRSKVGSALRELYKHNRPLAQFYYGLLTTRADHLLEETDLPSLEECFQKIDRLEHQPLSSHTFASLFWDNDHRGIHIAREELQGGGLVYSVTLMTRSNLLKQVARAEFRAARSQPEPFALICTVDDWIVVPRDQIQEIPKLFLMLRVLVALHNFRYRMIPVEDIDTADLGPNRPPKENETLIRLCALAYQGKLECTRVIVPLDAVVPNDMEHALAYPLEEVRRLRSSHIDGTQACTEMLLYQRGGRLIMDDDYSAYLSYKSLGFKRVPAVILGKFHAPGVDILERGGEELIPPIMVEIRSSRIKEIALDEMEMLEQRMQYLAPPAPSQVQLLSKIYFEFCHLLERRKKKEADLHAFLKRHPMLIDAHVAQVHSEVRVGAFRADLVLRYRQSDKRVLLIELERDDDRIFKRHNRLVDKVSHASQQIEDWIVQIRRNAETMPDWLKGEYTAEGLVVIGRSNQLSDEQKETLFNINSNRVVKIVTYDDLLERLNRLIVSLEETGT
ncbi:Shedu anti-phage system protein SduA domain-containing protein [Rhodoferax sp.]|uniref:Shedu immune nuclease family protein n=1 Tax=Rhodoferax sp. TaxID=50421 RepID=UPI00285289E9|nr:Shedu anti-phage system protein SduA domain-containing protein [Rhodoferax sp.]